jgi:hypothetical protein
MSAYIEALQAIATPFAWVFVAWLLIRAMKRARRDYIAAKAMHGLLVEPVSCGNRSSATVIMGRYTNSDSEAAGHFAEAAYKLADAMLAARGQQ